MFDDSTGNKYAEVAFESEMLALQAIKEFDGKEIIKKKVKIELVSNNKSTQSEEVLKYFSLNVLFVRKNFNLLFCFPGCFGQGENW